MKNKKYLMVIKLIRSCFVLPLICSLMISNCEAQKKPGVDTAKPDFVIAKEKKDSLITYSIKYGTSIESLRKLNPAIAAKKDIVNKKDTVFLREKAEMPPQPIQDDYTEKLVGKEPEFFKSVTFYKKLYFVCEVDPHKYKIEAYNQNENDNGLYDFNILAAMKKKDLLFAMNGGMYEEDFSPVGLFATEGNIINEINLRKDGRGNFYDIPPNGVFLLDNADNPFIVTSDNFAAGKFKVKLATQSGPMLVINGAFNTHINKGSANLLIRNAVGINKAGKVVFVISRSPVNFYEFAELFRDKLGCNNALYLDGVVSQCFIPESQPVPAPGPKLGVFLTVSKKTKENAPPIKKENVPEIKKEKKPDQQK